MPDSATLKNRLAENIKNTMRSGDREKLTTLRGIMAAVKQAEIDTRKVLDDTDILDILDRVNNSKPLELMSSRPTLIQRPVCNLPILSKTVGRPSSSFWVQISPSGLL